MSQPPLLLRLERCIQQQRAQPDRRCGPHLHHETGELVAAGKSRACRGRPAQCAQCVRSRCCLRPGRSPGQAHPPALPPYLTAAGPAVLPCTHTGSRRCGVGRLQGGGRRLLPAGAPAVVLSTHTGSMRCGGGRPQGGPLLLAPASSPHLCLAGLPARADPSRHRLSRLPASPRLLVRLQCGGWTRRSALSTGTSRSTPLRPTGSTMQQ